MPGVIMSDSATKKRKASAAPSTGKASSKPSKKVKAVKSSATNEEEDAQAQILSLETAILDSKKNYNNIATLIDICEQKTDGSNITAAIALCRVFCRLMVAERMIKKHGMPESETQAVDWLKGRFKDYVSILCDLLAIESLQSTTLTLLMRLVKEETQQEGNRAEQAWRTGVFSHVVMALVEEEEAEAAREEFVEKYVEEHDDVRYFTFYHIAYVATIAFTYSSFITLTFFSEIYSLAAIRHRPNVNLLSQTASPFSPR